MWKDFIRTVLDEAACFLVDFFAGFFVTAFVAGAFLATDFFAAAFFATITFPCILRS